MITVLFGTDRLSCINIRIIIIIIIIIIITIPSDMCSPTHEHISLVIRVPFPGTHISSDMCSLTWETHIPSEMAFPFPIRGTHITRDICLWVGEHISLGIYVSQVGLITSDMCSPTQEIHILSQYDCVPLYITSDG